MNERRVAQMSFMDKLTGMCMVTLIAFTVLLALIVPLRHLAQGSEIEISVVYHCVQSGDSLWTISAEHPIPGLTTQECSYWILEHNNLKSSGLIPGQIIEVPAT